MQNAFLSILVTSAVGTVLAIILAILRPLTRKLFSCHWHYCMWIAVLIVMVLPVRISLPENAVVPDIITYAEQISAAETVPMPDTALTAEYDPSYFPSVWLAVAFLLFSAKLINYFLFLSKLRRTSKPTTCPELSLFTDRSVRVLKSDRISSPLMTGIFMPTLLLPDTEMTSQQLHNVLAHEMTHFKRGDVICKWFVCIVKCIHWFNPAVCFISRQINTDCEISCDLKVTENMSKEEKLGYINTILSLVSVSKCNSLTTAMTGNKNSLKRRFKMIKNSAKSTKTKFIISAVMAAVIIVTTIFASGVLAGNVIDGTDSQMFTWPCPDSVTLSREFDADSHPAIDIIADEGSAILAVTGGKIVSAGYDSAHGNFVITDDGSVTVLYAHMSAIEVNEGESVSSGDIIGKVGKTGLATGAHLHLEMTENGKAISPLEYFPSVSIVKPIQRPF